MSKSFAYCRGCGRPVDLEARKCPKCGLLNPVKKSQLLKWAIWVLVAAAAGYALFLLLASRDPVATRPAEAQQAGTPDPQAGVVPEATTPSVVVGPAKREPAGPYDGPSRRAAEAYVRDQIESPQSASFSGPDETTTEPLQDGPPNQWVVKGHVESQDPSGGVLRNYYEVVIEFEGGRPNSPRLVSSIVQ